MYLTPEDARVIKWADAAARERLLDMPLQSKHLICSARYLPLVKELLKTQKTPRWSSSRVRFLMKRAGRIKQEVVLRIP